MDFTNFPEGYEEGDEPLTFHYSREHRLKTAPKLVQDYYSGKFGPKKLGLFRALVSTRANRLLLFSIAICIAVLMVNAFFGPKKNVRSLFGSDVTLAAFSFEDTVYSSVNLKKASAKYPYKDIMEVTGHFEFFDNDGQLVDTQIIKSKYDGNDLFVRTTSVDYDILKVNVKVELGSESVDLSTMVQKR